MLEDHEIYIGNIKARKLILTNAIGYDDLYYFITKDETSYILQGIDSEKYHKVIFQRSPCYIRKIDSAKKFNEV